MKIRKMNDSLLVGIFVLSLLILSGCQGIDLSQMSDEDLERISEKAVVCNEPYIRVGIECCLDKDSSGICDRDEIEEEKQKPITKNENSLPTETVPSTQPKGFVNPVSKNIISGNAVINKPKEAENVEIVEEKEEIKQQNVGGVTQNQQSTITYLGPSFVLTIEDSTEGPFNEQGKLQNSGKILSIQGPTFYNDFKITVQNEETDKVLCAVDRKIDIDTDFDGQLDIEGVYSLDRHILKIKPLATEEIKSGIESVPGNVQGYQGKGEIWTEYTTRCYFCLDESCDAYETQGETKQKALFRVKINSGI